MSKRTETIADRLAANPARTPRQEQTLEQARSDAAALARTDRLDREARAQD